MLNNSFQLTLRDPNLGEGVSNLEFFGTMHIIMADTNIPFLSETRKPETQTFGEGGVVI